ncbi:hypothetical protein [Paenibacillus taiwanensis]|uniref:hypothetical protein n=1 Tax=Paenibacillus taiwanensis TaxID=401638 RepID=UPI0003F94C9E|nr:hypothetical protein [Paenibacillus taiwanensis]
MEKMTVIDSIMGSGKTSWAIQHINDSPAEKRFIFITPFLDEIARVIDSVSSRKFVQPDNDNAEGRKMYDLKQLVRSGADICASHSLFRTADDELIELLTEAKYTLILDETMDVIERVNIKKHDIEALVSSEYIQIEGNRVVWIFDEYSSLRFRDIKELAQAGNLFVYRDTFMVWTFPPRIFSTFDEVYTMTYMFEGQLQRYYFDLYGIEYEYKSVTKDAAGNYELCEYDTAKENRSDLLQLIELHEGKLNDVAKSSTALSTSWLGKASGGVITQLNRNLYTFLRNHCKAKANEIIWTTLKDYQHSLQGRGFANSFLACNARATNDYADRWALAYLYNRYMNPQERAFFEENGVTVNQNALAVSDLLQWVWRSRIRRGEPIKLYLPSSRMRSLLLAWSKYEI